MESEKTNLISQHVESDATPPPPDRTISFEFTPEAAQSADHAADENADDDEDQRPVIGDVQDSIVVGSTRRNHVSPVSSL